MLCAAASGLRPTRLETRRVLLSGAGSAILGAALPALAMDRPKEEEIRPFKGGADKRSADVTVNVNTATGASYTDLPGMYPTIAGRIVDHVRRSGNIKSLAELLETEDVIQGNENIKNIIRKNEARLEFK
jgi:hypothetical protein